MGGYGMMILVEGENREEALRAADSVIGDLFETHDLVEGDKGYVDALQYPDEESEILSAKEDPAKFVARLRELTQKRGAGVHYYLRQAINYAKKAGFNDLLLLKPEEVAGDDAGMAGWALKGAGEVAAGYWCRQGILYDPENYHCGVDEDRIKEIEAKPDEWWLIETTVG